MGSIKRADFLDSLSNCQLLKEDAAPWNYLISEFAWRDPVNQYKKY
jgi:hypothetical protein